MSHITSIMITGTFNEEDEPQVFKWLNEYRPKELPFQDVPQRFTAGSKVVSSTVLLAAFNYLDEEEFIEHVKAIRHIVEPWIYETIQLFLLKDDPESLWQEINIHPPPKVSPVGEI